MTDDQPVIIFVRAPEVGRVKTRLAASLGDTRTLALYMSFVADLMETLQKTGRRVVVAFHPAHKRIQVEQWLGRDRHLIPQRGAHLGERMANALQDSFSAGVGSAVLIGSDVPQLSPAIIESAFLSFENHETVIGPCTDGGYYLIGFRNDTFQPCVFQGIPWGTDEVFTMTMNILERKSSHVRLLPELRDIDTLQDLRALYRSRSGNDFNRSATMRLLRNMERLLLPE